MHTGLYDKQSTCRSRNNNNNDKLLRLEYHYRITAGPLYNVKQRSVDWKWPAYDSLRLASRLAVISTAAAADSFLRRLSHLSSLSTLKLSLCDLADYCFSLIYKSQVLIYD